MERLRGRMSAAMAGVRLSHIIPQRRSSFRGGVAQVVGLLQFEEVRQAGMVGKVEDALAGGLATDVEDDACGITSRTSKEVDVSSHFLQTVLPAVAEGIITIALASPASSQASAPCAQGACSNGGTGAQGGGNRVEELPPILYTAIDGHTETLIPWQGRHVSVLVEPGVTRDPQVMSNLVGALDRAWDYYEATTGRVPGTAHSLNGRDEVAEVTSTCGAGCTYIGATGTEILTSYFESMYQEIAEHDLYNQIPFYELGRSFWFWSQQLEFQPPDQDPVVTGFAVLMRFRSMAAAHVKGAPFNGIPFATFASQVEALAGQYEADPSLTFAETLAQAKSPGLYGGTDFWASLMMQLAERHGGQTFVDRFWHHASDLPVAVSTTDAVTNWEQDASYAACTDLSPVFYERWGFPRPNGSITPRPPASTVPEPKGHC
jgi:hypothetical protein